ncbi:MAG: GTP cyclohydrolase II [Myxococcota bacterium]
MDHSQTDHPPKGVSPSLTVYAEAPLPTARGKFRTVVFREEKAGIEHVAMVKGELAGEDDVVARIHSECLTSEVFGSLKCDCRAQLDHAMDLVAEATCGVVLYLRQEGRGIGLGNKIRAYKLQSEGHDTYEANRLLGFGDDLRRYDIAAGMLRLLGVRSVRLITNNPLKIAALEAEGLPVRGRVPSLTPVNPHNEGYLRIKQERTGHLLHLPDAEPAGGT